MANKKNTEAGDHKRLEALQKKLQRARTEEDVKGAWTKCLDLEYDTADDIDLYTPQVIFEFKFNPDLLKHQNTALVIAQTLYYLRRLKRGQGRKAIPPAFALIDRASVVLGQVSDWRDLFTDAERVALEFADAMTITGRDVSDELFARLQAVYDDDDALVELTATIAWENSSSKFNRALRVPSQRLWKRHGSSNSSG